MDQLELLERPKISNRAIYEKIKDVIGGAGRPLAAFEFETVPIWVEGGMIGAREYVGCTESTLSRRMREMASCGMLLVRTRRGKNYREYLLP